MYERPSADPPFRGSSISAVLFSCHQNIPKFTKVQALFLGRTLVEVVVEASALVPSPLAVEAHALLVVFAVDGRFGEHLDQLPEYGGGRAPRGVELEPRAGIAVPPHRGVAGVPFRAPVVDAPPVPVEPGIPSSLSVRGFSRGFPCPSPLSSSCCRTSLAYLVSFFLDCDFF